MQVGRPQALPETAWINIDLHDLRHRIKIAAFRRVMTKPGAHANHKIRLGKAFTREVTGECAGDIEGERISVE